MGEARGGQRRHSQIFVQAMHMGELGVAMLHDGPLRWRLQTMSPRLQLFVLLTSTVKMKGGDSPSYK